MSFALAILENVLRIAEEKNARKVGRIKVEVGELLLINPEQLEFCFRAISKNTVAENATIEIETVKADVRCMECGREHSDPYGICQCGGIISVEGGKEFVLKSISMEVEDAQD